jgi:phenylacetate-CoA ligase
MEYAYLVAGWSRAGFELGMPVAVLRGRVVPADRTGLHHEYDWVLRHHYYSSFHLTGRDIPRYLEHIRALGPCFLHVYPSSVMAVVRYLQSAGEAAPANILGVLAESEAVPEDDRLAVARTFGCRYFSSYGLTEKVVAATACEHSNLYHVWPTYGYFELLDEQGDPVTTPGMRGEIVGTGFVNTAVPFIRYRTGDFATYAGDRCTACGRTHPLIADIQPRRPQEWFVATDGSLIAWTALNMHDNTFENVLRFQFHQDTPGRAVLKIVPSPSFSDADLARITRNLAIKLNGVVELTVELASSIRVSDVGKAICIDQRLSITP